MTNIWAGIVGALGVALAAWFAARATKAAAQATAEASRAAAQAAAEPAQRERDLEAFKAIRDDMQEEIRDLRSETTRLRSVVRAFAGYVGELTLQMRAGGITPPEPPPLIDEYNRTGV
ncbi:hypothetical protein [Streptomyces sp. Ac-502]|uniref:hypothetical protein n=1 Tax=Streptomyces sp. Ac-502 TaxID=3342801 RepID=UPI00386222FD